MRTTVHRLAGLRLGALLLALGSGSAAVGATLEVSVLDDQGRPVENVAVYATRASEVGALAAPQAHSMHAAVMDQKDLTFAPHVLVVERGASVTFPNSDDVSHHVYSFSEAKPFELALYKGEAYPPVVFDRAGIVVLGCNIHDGMLGYIVVVDTPLHAVTNEQGVALIEEMPPGDYVVAAWTPRVRSAGLPPPRPVTVVQQMAAAEIRLAGRLAPAHEHGASSLTWERY